MTKTNAPSPSREENGKILTAHDIGGILYAQGVEPEGKPHKETLTWLQTFTHGEEKPNAKLSPEKAFIVVLYEGNEPFEIWESLSEDPEENCWESSEFQRIWKNPEVKDWDVTITATVTKTLRVSAKTEQEATDFAHERFSVKNSEGENERYNEDVDNIEEVSEDEED